jgi:integrase
LLAINPMQRQGRKPQTIRNVFFALRASLTIAVENGALRANPCTGIKLPSNETAGNEVTTTFLRAEQVAQLADAIRPPFATMIYTAAYTGLRAGELCPLRVQDLDLLRRRIHVRASIAEVDGQLIRVATKTKRQRTVGLPVFLAEILAAYLADRPHGPDDLVFDDPTRPGTWLRQANWYVTYFKPAVRKAGLPTNIRFHDLRHTCASLLIAQGADPKAVSTRLGHTTVQMTLDRYTHLFANRDDEITTGLDTMYRAAAGATVAIPTGEVVPLR